MVTAGKIIFAPCLDPPGRNLKSRPLLVTADALSNETLRCVGISSKYDYPLPPTQIALPYANRGGQCKSGLTTPCVAICSWIIFINPVDIERVLDFVNRPLLEQIIAIVDETTPIDPDTPEP